MAEQGRPGARDLEGRYANYFDIGANENELVIDFGQFYGHANQPTLHTRIITTPVYARELLGLLTRSMKGLELASHAPDPAHAAGPAVPDRAP